MSKKYTVGSKINQAAAKKIILGIIIAVALGVALFSLLGGSNAQSVNFRVLSETEIPQQMLTQVIPEYRQLERALACLIDGKVYVLATRGEKSGSGYEINICSMELAETDQGTVLTVYAEFKDPDPSLTPGQALTYPFQVAETNLTELPQDIELKVKYAN